MFRWQHERYGYVAKGAEIRSNMVHEDAKFESANVETEPFPLHYTLDIPRFLSCWIVGWLLADLVIETIQD